MAVQGKNQRSVKIVIVGETNVQTSSVNNHLGSNISMTLMNAVLDPILANIIC